MIRWSVINTRPLLSLSVILVVVGIVIGAMYVDRVRRGPTGSTDIITTGEVVPELKPFDRLLTSFLAEHGIPGASVCVSRNGKIIYARGFGWADAADERPVEPDSLFRIASVSKPITAVAIMRLVEQGKIALDDHPFKVIGRAQQLARSATDSRLERITIQHLLQHRAGWDRSESGDPMFQYRKISGIFAPVSHRATIDYMLRQPLDFAPGSKYAYSNFGYCLLGRVIEAVTGQTYEEYVQEHVLSLVGVTDMKIGRSLPRHRADREVSYYDVLGRQGIPVRDPTILVPQPYVIDHEVMDSHGAWIASATDLVKFADALNDYGASPLLTATSIEAMFAPPSGSEDEAAYYACGWMVRPVNDSANTWHMGQINGTSTLLVRRHDGLNWAVLFNQDGSLSAKGTPASLIDPLMHDAARRVKAWPE